MHQATQTQPKYEVTKRFVSGMLAGLTITETTDVKFTPSRKVVKPCAGSSAYVVEACMKVAS